MEKNNKLFELERRIKELNEIGRKVIVSSSKLSNKINSA
jgi:hypothetical protein